MARARNIKPSLFKNEVLGVADPLLTILFESLWCLSDREGRLEDRPLRIKGETFPYREGLDVNGYLTELARMGFIRRYKVGETAVIQVLKFKEHQSPHNTEKKSVLPAYDENSTNNQCGETVTVKPPLINVKLTEQKRPDSLIPDSLIPSLKPLGGKPPDERFEECWKRYPKRSGNNPKADALKSWNARLKENIPKAAMESGLDRYIAWCEATGKIGTETVMQAVRFFGKSRPFEQEWELPKKPPNGNGGMPWWSSDATILAKGRECNLDPRPGESMHEFKGRINVALGAQP